jgi:glycerol-3-phosphate cytidylyltransferase
MNYDIPFPFLGRGRAAVATPAAPPSLSALKRPVARTILTYGGFDGFHTGHGDWLRQLSRLGSDLVVGCHSDAFCTRLGQPAQKGFAARRAVLERCRFVSRVIPLETWDQTRSDIVNYNVSVLALPEHIRLPMSGLDEIVQVLRLPMRRRQTASRFSA